ncbi:MAG: DUF1922 domain-containing protein [Candidatus Bathyarchaeia archaeon]
MRAKRYLIIRCERCGKLTLASSNSVSRTCPSCGHRQKVLANPPIASSESPEEIRKILGALKSKGAGSWTSRHKDLRKSAE